MTEATQTTFFRDFFGKEMSENSGLATAVRVVELQLFGGGSLEIGNWKLKIINYLAGGHWKLEIEN